MLDAVVAEVRAIAPEQGVDDEPALVKAEVIHAGADEATHQRAGAVTADDEGGAHLGELAVGQVLVAHAHTVVVLVQGKYLAAVAELDLRPALQTLDEDILQIGLVEAIAEMPAHRREVL